MPAGMGEEERFAAAVELGTTPGPVGRGDSLPRDLEIVALLRDAGPALAPDPRSREQARRRLMAAFAEEFAAPRERGRPAHDSVEATGPMPGVTAVALAEREPAPAAGDTPSRRADRRPEQAPRRTGRHAAPGAEDEPGATVHALRPARRHRRAPVVQAAAAAALVALAGSGMFASRDALPGDPMYGVKRVAESTGLALTFGEQAKARRHLEQAQRRLDEVEGMVSRTRTAPGSASGSARATGSASGSGSATGSASGSASGSVDPEDAELMRTTMQEFGDEATEGSRLLLASAERDAAPDTEEVEEVRTWAAEQSERLSELRPVMPEPDEADESLALLDRLLDETAAITGEACPAGSAAPAAPVDACEPAAPAPAPAPQSPATSGEADVRTSTGADEGEADRDADADAGGSVRTSADPARPPARGTTTEGGSTDRDDDRRGADDSDGGADERSDDDDDISVPAPLPARVDVPPVVPGLPGLSIGG